MTVTLDAGDGASIVERAARGDEVAFARLVAAYHADMVRVAHVTCGDPELAQDAVQAAWTIAWRKLGSVRDPDRVKGWLVSVAANEARQLVRRRHRRTVVELKVDEAGPRADDPGDLIERVDLVNALGHLKPEDRMLLALRYVAGLDSFELGARLRMSPSGTRGSGPAAAASRATSSPPRSTARRRRSRPSWRWRPRSHRGGAATGWCRASSAISRSRSGLYPVGRYPTRRRAASRTASGGMAGHWLPYVISRPLKNAR